jgi:hypothetical protein
VLPLAGHLRDVHQLVSAADARLVVPVLEAAPVLAGVEPGAFLDHTSQLSARGHVAIAAALERVLAESAPR